MTTLEQITTGSLIKGIAGPELVTVVAVKWHGSSAITVNYRQANGSLNERLLYREDEVNLEIAEPTTHWSFDGDQLHFG